MTDNTAGVGPVERGVRPAAWKRKGGDLRGVSYLPMESGDEPLYDQAALDAAVAAERERWKAAIRSEIGHAETNDTRLVPSFGKAKGSLAVRVEYLLALIERA